MKTKMKKMGMGGMHAMLDGTMMPDKAMMKKGGAKKTVKKPVKKYFTGGPTGDEMGTMKSGSKPKDPKTFIKSSGKGMTATNPIKKLGGMMKKGGIKKK